jgi:hypothetical protein
VIPEGVEEIPEGGEVEVILLSDGPGWLEAGTPAGTRTEESP